VHQIHIDLARLGQRLLNRLARDLMKDHAFDRLFGVEHLAQMPADALTLAIFVGGENDLIRLLNGLAQVADDLPFFVRDHIQRLKVGLHVDPQPRPGFTLGLGGNLRRRSRQVTHMPHAGLDAVLFRQITADGSCFGG
jgi:hypothetical protein